MQLTLEPPALIDLGPPSGDPVVTACGAGHPFALGASPALLAGCHGGRVPVISGDPGAVEAAAGDLGRAGRDLVEAGESVRAHGRVVTAGWTGEASDAAATTIDAVGSTVLTGADAVIAAEAVYLAYAVELRAAQREHAAGQNAVAAGRAGQLAAAAQAVRASGRVVLDPGRDAALVAAQQASDAAAEVVAQGEAVIAAALERERVANEVATAAVRELTEQVRRMTRAIPAQPPYGSTAALAPVGLPAARPEPADDGGWFRDAVGGLGHAAWSVGPGFVAEVGHLSPFEADEQVADRIDGVEGWLEDWYGAATDSGAYRSADVGGQVLGMAVPGSGWGKAVSKADEVATIAPVLRLPIEEAWGDVKTLDRHFRKHGEDFGSVTRDAYVEEASSFFQTGLQSGLPLKVDQNGISRLYDPETNSFGSYNPDGTIRTYFKPTSPDYWAKQPGSPQ